jgi:hypothetical protein
MHLDILDSGSFDAERISEICIPFPFQEIVLRLRAGPLLPKQEPGIQIEAMPSTSKL